MRVLDLRNHEVRQAREHKALRGLPVLARGVFSAVFDTGHSILKLTTDPVTYALLSDSTLSRDPHFPKVIKRYGIVGKQGDVFLYLIEIEKLKPIFDYKREQKIASPLFSSFDSTTESRKYEVWTGKEHAEWLDGEAEKDVYPASFSRAMKKLSRFVEKFDAALDLHWGNIMVRPGQKRTLVFSDPVFNTNLFDRFASGR